MLIAMIRQYRIDRFNGIEWLVCEVYFKHTWNKEENDAFAAFLDASGGIHIGISKSEFSVLLDEWLSKEHAPQDSFYGLVEPIPVVESIPHLVIRGAIVNNKVASLNVDYMDSVTPQVVMDSVSIFYAFVRSPHWRNAIATQISNYGSLFGSEDDS